MGVFTNWIWYLDIFIMLIIGLYLGIENNYGENLKFLIRIFWLKQWNLNGKQFFSMGETKKGDVIIYFMPYLQFEWA